MSQASIAVKDTHRYVSLCWCRSPDTVALQERCSSRSLTVGSKGVTQVVLSIFQGPFAGDIGLDCEAKSG
jgi:hypothetical protein